MVARRSVRKRTREAILVTNAMTGATIGRIGNLSADGMMLIGPAAIEESCLFQVQFLLRDAAAQPRRLEIGIQCLWSQAMRTERSHWAGCRIIDISPDEQQVLDAWVEHASELA
ncbi:MAG: PilZ domain-containing protein [Xanthomonadales bacterium]|nr:hypothetical protein [Xanthomonadales bacterium]MCC6594852.1 PilZ domain-containing protein [Xanthomonadales bacterium]MCE7930097.1 hypothetical protein [Xanthomonadales bacterium PRO6]